MGLTFFLLMIGAAFAATHKLAIPAVERGWAASSNRAKYAKAGVLAALTTLRTFLQIAIWAAVATLLAAALIWLASRIGWDVSLSALHRLTGEVLGWLQGFAKGLAAVLFWLALAANGWLSYRVVRGGLQRQLDSEFAVQKRALADDLMAGRLAELPPNDEMTQGAELLARAEAQRGWIQANTPEDQPALAAADATIDRLFSFIVNTDLDRRVDLGKVALPVAEGKDWWPQIQLVLFSKGSLKLGERAQKYASRLATALACFLVVGVSAPALAGGAIAPLFASLTDLRVFASTDAAAKTLGQFAQSATAPPAVDGAEPQPTPAGDVYHQAASQFVRAIARPGLWTGGVGESLPGERVWAATPTAQQRDVGELMVREAILSEYVAGRPDVPIASEGLAASGDAQTQRRYRAMLGGLGTDPARAHPELVGRAEGYLRAEGAAKPGFEARLRAGLAEFRQPATAWDYASAALGEVLGQALDEALPELASFAEKQAVKRVVKSGLKKTVDRVVQVKFAGLLNDLRRGRSWSEALKAATAVEAGSPVLRAVEAQEFATRFTILDNDEARLVDNLASKTPALRLVASEAERERVRPFASLIDRGAPLRSLEGALGNYDTLFEGNARSLEQAALAELDPASFDPANRGVDSPARFQLARNSVEMDRSTRVGGIVIGAMPDSSRANGSFDSLEWRRSGADFELFLVPHHGESVPIGTFPGPMIQQALAYAADERTVAVTIVNTGLPEFAIQHVNLHPALIESQLGNDIVDLDKFVFDAMGECANIYSQLPVCLIERVGYQLQYYKFAESVLHRENGIGGQSAEVPDMRADWVFLSAWKPSEPRQSIFANHPSYFDQRLVRRLQYCARTQANGFEECISKDQSAVLHGISPPSHIVSGVREAPYDLADDWSRNRPLEFVAQITFDHSTIRDRQFEISDVLIADDGRAPWIFPEIAEEVQANTDRYVSDSLERQRIVEQAETFTRLQRAFRLALAGKFGPRFQIGSLLTLMREAKQVEKISFHPTPQWTGSRSQASSLLADMRRKATTNVEGASEDEVLKLSLQFLNANISDPQVHFLEM